MEPLTSAAIVVATVGLTKAWEKTVENVIDPLTKPVGDYLATKVKNFWPLLKQHAPDTASAIELAPQQPLDIGQAVLEVDSAAKANPEFERAVRELAEAAKADPNPEIAEKIKEIEKEADKLKYQQPTIQNLAKLAEKIATFNQGIINIRDQTNNYTF